MQNKRTPESSIMLFGSVAIRVDAVKELYPQDGQIIIATETARHVLQAPEGGSEAEAEKMVAMISRSYGEMNGAEEPDAEEPDADPPVSFNALEEAARAAETGGNHFYTNPRDSNSWQENELFHRLASPEAVLFLIEHYKSTTTK